MTGYPVTLPPEVVLDALAPADVARCAALEQVLFPGDEPWSAAAFSDELQAGHTYLAARIAGELVGYSALVCATVIATRFLFAFTMPYVVRAVDRRASQRERRVGPRQRIVSSWAGMRGILTIATALALPQGFPTATSSSSRPSARCSAPSWSRA